MTRSDIGLEYQADSRCLVNRETAASVAQSAAADALARRYQDASMQLGHEKAAVRLAGVYAIARLADDWPQERQTCIDVLCGCLRMPPRKRADASIDSDDAEFRRAILDTIELHLRDLGETTWEEARIDLSRAVLPRMSTLKARLGWQFFLESAFITEDLFISNSSITWYFSMRNAEISSTVIFRELDIRGNGIGMSGLRITQTGYLQISADHMEREGLGSGIFGSGIEVLGLFEIVLTASKEAQGSWMLLDLHLGSTAKMKIVSALGSKSSFDKNHSWQKLRESNWMLDAGAQVEIEKMLVDNGIVEWKDHQISEGAKVSMLSHVPLQTMA